MIYPEEGGDRIPTISNPKTLEVTLDTLPTIGKHATNTYLKFETGNNLLKTVPGGKDKETPFQSPQV